VQDEIAALCRETGLRVLGPNCLGAVSASRAVVVSFSSGLRGRHEPGTTAMVSQSGALALWLYTGAQRAGLRFSQFVTTGNEADLTVSRVLREIVELDETQVLLAYFEAIHDVGALRELARRARELDKPVVVLKAARSEQGARAAASHTASLAGSDRAADALLSRLGLLRVGTTTELLDAARVFAPRRRARGRRLTILSVSGGGGIMMADAASAHGLDVVEWEPEWQARMAEAIPAYGSPRNPVDVTGSASANPRMLEDALRVAVAHPGTDLIAVFGGDTALSAPWITSICAVHGETDVPIVVGWLGAAESVRRFTDAGVPVFGDPTAAIDALALLVRHSLDPEEPLPPDAPPDPLPEPVRALLDRVRAEGRDTLDELEAGTLLRAFGVDVAPGARAASVEEAVRAADELGYPVAVKVLSPVLAHKSDVGGVALGLGDPSAVREAAARLLDLAAERSPAGDAAHAGPDSSPAVLVQAMAPPGVEMVLGMHRDDTAGPVVLVGSGGVLVELLDDVTVALPPLSTAAAGRLVDSLRGSALLSGLRGADPVDRDALVDLVVGFAAMVHALRDELAEVDVNPVVVGPSGAVAVDAFVRVRDHAATP
ncbi:MAG: acetate--CoA ligase family protein, partial [Pseudonocardia sediminis]